MLGTSLNANFSANNLNFGAGRKIKKTKRNQKQRPYLFKKFQKDKEIQKFNIQNDINLREAINSQHDIEEYVTVLPGVETKNIISPAKHKTNTQKSKHKKLSELLKPLNLFILDHGIDRAIEDGIEEELVSSLKPFLKQKEVVSQLLEINGKQEATPFVFEGKKYVVSHDTHEPDRLKVQIYNDINNEKTPNINVVLTNDFKAIVTAYNPQQGFSDKDYKKRMGYLKKAIIKNNLLQNTSGPQREEEIKKLAKSAMKLQDKLQESNIGIGWSAVVNASNQGLTGEKLLYLIKNKNSFLSLKSANGKERILFKKNGEKFKITIRNDEKFDKFIIFTGKDTPKSK